MWWHDSGSARASRLSVGVVALAVVVVVPRGALAGNGTHPRTPVVWSDVPCLTIVDRSQDPVLVFEYDIPFEDTEVTPDEVEQSRTHQFFAFCRDRIDLQTEVPSWITEADAIDAEMHGLNTAEEELGPEDHLETSTEWTDCWIRITEDSDRRPITFAAAGEPVVWDTTGLSAGGWQIEGYTYEPWFNIWKQRPGVVKIVDGPDPADVAPVAALDEPEELVIDGTSLPLSGCIDAMEGTTLSLAWASVVAAGETPAWQPIVEDEPVLGASFEVVFDAPEEAVDALALWIRVEVTDPMDRNWTGYSDWAVELVPTDGNTTGICLDPEGCDDTGEESGGTTVGPGENDGTSGCACATNRSSAPLAVLLVILAAGFLPARRRRVGR